MVTYPKNWEADVVLRDGATAHVRPIVPSDADGIQLMHSKQSPESIYLRFFAPMPTIPPRDLERFVNVDYHDRVALVMVAGEEIIGVGRYDRLDETSAEVAFNIADAHQGRGIGSILLEHLAAVARERGLSVFTAEVLPQNRSMLQVFAAAGYEISREFEDGVVAVRFEIDPTERSKQVLESREHRAEALSVRSVLNPASVAVIGASRKRASAGNLLLRNLASAGFKGDLHIVHPHAPVVAGMPTVKSLQDIEGTIDLAIIAVPAPAVVDVVKDAASRGVRAVVVISSGFAETGPEGQELQREVVATARSHGMRVVGPNSFGIANTSTDVALNASLSPFFPEPGPLGLFSQSGALGTGLLAAAKSRGLGISTFVSAGNRADLSGNDLLQFWEEDESTQIVGLYLESIGNPRKFARIARRVARQKPVIVIKSDLTGRELPPGHQVRVSSLSGSALNQVLTQAGVIRADSIHQMFDVAQVFATQPLPSGARVGVIGNSAALSTLIVQRARAEGLRIDTPPVSLHPEVTTDEFEEHLAKMYKDPSVHSVIVAFAPSARGQEREITQVLAEQAAVSGKTTVACFLGLMGAQEELTAYTRSAEGKREIHTVPSYMGPEDAVWALARVTEYAQWKRSDQGNYPELEGFDKRALRALIEKVLQRDSEHDSEEGTTSATVRLTRDETQELLHACSIQVLPYHPSSTVEEAKEIARKIGYPVALKAVDSRLRHRLDLGGVRLDVSSDEEMDFYWKSIRDVIAARLDDDADTRIDVQTMAAPGVACVVRGGEDPLLGPMVSFGLAGDSSELLDDVQHRVAPLTDVDAKSMVRSLGSSPRLFGYRGGPVMNVAPLEETILRVAALIDEFPAIRLVEFRPISVTESEQDILSVRIELNRESDRIDSARRRMSAH
ncbi:CoA binding domain protein [Brevibacterium mcbrellneri ATCC 49030]|uniref:CoA binding domain protein n=1 Tax=Brevibacterium mcbrellneri ATCC 49030 TaxID=585530 RepID=D4YNL6_9MICO|nr:GNAT family N-acetyltransferase [Brevibacterium mcbrellneri]EFG47262.1 CoA binding domain protein [Brevibacterium mcbrellneri ATCC 49030]